MDKAFENKLIELAEKSSIVDEELYKKYNVKRGLRNADFTGVLVGLTHIGDVIGYDTVDGKISPAHGRLIYQGIDVNELVKGFQKDKRFGFDETTFLLLFGKLPTKDELGKFSEELTLIRDLPKNFTEDMILTLRGEHIMNMLARCVLALYAVDKNADDTSTKKVLEQSMNLIAKFPTIIAYSYQGLRHTYKNENLSIRHPEKRLSTAENFLYMLKGHGRYTRLEAEILDLALVLHAEHGGGNNSSFTMHVVSSSGTDTYSSVAAALGSLKGPLHGGANIRVKDMMDEMKKKVKDWKSEEAIGKYLKDILAKKGYDKSGKIYGFGHAVYTLSDPRAVILKEKAKELAKEKGKGDEFELYEAVERIAPKVFAEAKGPSAKVLCANVDYFSGFVYDCLGIPKEIFTPLFAMARITGWCAHRMEELISSRRIIRPAYKNITQKKCHVPLSERN